MPVGEFCNREVVITQRGTPIIEAAKLMRRHHVGDIVVVDYEEANPLPVGMLTDRDIVVEIIAYDLNPASLTAGDVMMDWSPPKNRTACGKPSSGCGPGEYAAWWWSTRPAGWKGFSPWTIC